MFKEYLTQFPSQKKSTAAKTPSWGKQCVDALESMILLNNEGIRKSRQEKKVNYDLYNDILDKKDMEKICNPFNIDTDKFPAEVKNYPIMNRKIKRLVGEELGRRFDFKITVTNPDAISEKEEEQKKIVQEFLYQKLQAKQLPEEELQKDMEKLQKYINYEMQDLRELSATRLIEYYFKELNLKTVCNRGFEDALIAGEEIYCVDEIAGEPYVRKCNPLNTYALTSPDNPELDTADAILEEFYLPVGQVIDLYYDELKATDISKLENKDEQEGDNELLGYKTKLPTFSSAELSEFDTAVEGHDTIGGAYDTSGNVRVVHVRWKSFRKIGILTYLDEAGEEQKIDVPEEYEVDETTGETVKWIWISEYWEGTKIANDIYVRVRPRPIQFRKLENKSYCASGYVGTIYNSNSSKALSLFSLMKKYQYLYNAYMYRTELAFIKAKGKIGVLDLAMVPDGWDMDMWMYYAEVMGWAVKDSFKEAKKGAATGKLAGNMSGQSDAINLELGNYIQQHIEMLRYLEEQIDAISGINRQREGDVNSSDGLGTTEIARQMSSTITEPLFYTHEQTKLRLLKTVLETAKYCVRKGSKKLQNIMDDMSTAIYTIDGELLNEAEYGLHLSNSSSDAELMRALKDLAHAGIQNDKINFGQLMDIYTTSSINAIRRKIERTEQEKIQRDQQAQQQQLESQQKIEAERIAFEREKLDREDYNREQDRIVEIQVAQIKALGFAEDQDADGDGIPDPIEVGELALKSREVDLKADDRRIKEKEIENKKEVEKLKIKQVEVQNKNQEKMQNKELEYRDKELKMKEKELKMKEKIERLKLRNKPTKK